LNQSNHGETVLDVRKSMNCWIKRCTLSLVFHEQEIVRCTSFNLHLADRVPIIRTIVLRAWIGKFWGVFELVLDLTASFGFECSRFFVCLADFNVLAADAVHCEVVCHALVTLSFVVSWPWNWPILWHKALLSRAKGLYRCCPRLSSTHRYCNACFIFLWAWKILDTEDVHWSSRQESCRVCPVSWDRARIGIIDEVVSCRTHVWVLRRFHRSWEPVSSWIKTLELLDSRWFVEWSVLFVDSVGARPTKASKMVFLEQMNVFLFLLVCFTLFDSELFGQIFILQR